MREIRFSLASLDSDVTNSWGGWPAPIAASPFMLLRVTVSGTVDEHTGYLCNIKSLDTLLRTRALPALLNLYSKNIVQKRAVQTERLLIAASAAVDGRSPQNTIIRSLELCLTPYLSYTFDTGEPSMLSITESFEFCAGHRMYKSDFSEKKNYEVFGKCANPHGHGHNYRLEVTLSGTPDPHTGIVLPIQDFERVVKDTVLDDFDHKNLNLEVSEFSTLNPSVENIAQVIWNRLQRKFQDAALARVRVYETEKTYAEISRPTT